ncbi:MAG: hypothetical protein IT576_08265, partial [Verrucomicrobiales bacterium]|nr:hypothetical protein [Verrucomicrobiales bacterium]
MKFPSFCLPLFAAAVSASAQTPAAKTLPFVPNYDEAKIPSHTLPDPLVSLDGSRVTTVEQWKSRRAEIYGLFEKHVYGRIPGG